MCCAVEENFNMYVCILKLIRFAAVLKCLSIIDDVANCMRIFNVTYSLLVLLVVLMTTFEFILTNYKKSVLIFV